jgi:hypothetical protein
MLDVIEYAAGGLVAGACIGAVILALTDQPYVSRRKTMWFVFLNKKKNRRRLMKWASRASKNMRARLHRRSLSLFPHQKNLIEKWTFPFRSLPPNAPQNQPSPVGAPWASYSVAPNTFLTFQGPTGTAQYQNNTPYYQVVRVDMTTNQVSVVTPPQKHPWQYGSDRPLLRGEKPKDVLEVNHPLLGYRAFQLRYARRIWDVMGRVIPLDPVLGSLNIPYGEWHPGVNEARHNGAGGHAYMGAGHILEGSCPVPNGQCGFWSLDDLNAAVAKQRWPETNEWIPVVGLIQGWGRFQRHSDGYRFQYASVIAMSVGVPNEGVTGPAYDFGVAAVREMARQFDAFFVERNADLIKIKTNEEAKYAAP